MGIATPVDVMEITCRHCRKGILALSPVNNVVVCQNQKCGASFRAEMADVRRFFVKALPVMEGGHTIYIEIAQDPALASVL